MEKILNFIVNNYIVILVITGILILSLIGYLVDAFSKRDFKIKK